jgi:hypothetical protein
VPAADARPELSRDDPRAALEVRAQTQFEGGLSHGAWLAGRE